jgi:hypothetical protein
MQTVHVPVNRCLWQQRYITRTQGILIQIQRFHELAQLYNKDQQDAVLF